MPPSALPLLDSNILNIAPDSLKAQDTSESHCAIVSPVPQEHFLSPQMALGNFWGRRTLMAGVTLGLIPRGNAVMFITSL